MKPIWIVNNDQSIRWALEKALARENLLSRSFTNVCDVFNALDEEAPQILISDVRMPGGSGLDLLRAIKVKYPGLPVTIMTAYFDLDDAAATLQGGTFEYLTKPPDVDRAIELIRRALEESLREEKIDGRLSDALEILGQAPAMQGVFRAVERLSQSNVTVLIIGGSGMGEELVVRALRKHSPCASGPFIALNTATIPEDLLESELFGHERGAFTGVQTMRRGRFEQAEDGTLFLDGIGDMPFSLQTRLLRVLSDGHFYRMGGHNPLKANMHVIAATYQSLETRVKNSLFHEDLFHQLNMIRLHSPALREHSEDVTLLARHFLQKGVKKLGVESRRMSNDTLARIATLSFPDNIRRLGNLYNWFTVMTPAQTIESKDLLADLVRDDMQMLPVVGEAAARPAFIGEPSHGGEPYGATPSVDALPSNSAAGASVTAGWGRTLTDEAKAMLEANQPNVMNAPTRRFEKTILGATLGVTRGHHVEAAMRLGTGRSTITRKLQELDFD